MVDIDWVQKDQGLPLLSSMHIPCGKETEVISLFIQRNDRGVYRIQQMRDQDQGDVCRGYKVS